jgi:uncharacterized protein
LNALRGGELDVVGGTAWVWSREDFAGSLDVLVVDEAGRSRWPTRSPSRRPRAA